jgi:hypothetical protein
MILIPIIFQYFQFTVFVFTDCDPVFWDFDDPTNDNLSVFVIQIYLFLGIMVLYTGNLLILRMIIFQYL